MTARWASFNRVSCWNPATCRLEGTVSTLWYVVFDDCFEHIGKGIVVIAGD